MSFFNAAPLKLVFLLIPIETCAAYSSAIATRYTRTVYTFSVFSATPSPSLSSSEESTLST
jgi:hypothetical protein